MCCSLEKSALTDEYNFVRTTNSVLSKPAKYWRLGARFVYVKSFLAD